MGHNYCYSVQAFYEPTKKHCSIGWIHVLYNYLSGRQYGYNSTAWMPSERTHNRTQNGYLTIAKLVIHILASQSIGCQPTGQDHLKFDLLYQGRMFDIPHANNKLQLRAIVMHFTSGKNKRKSDCL